MAVFTGRRLYDNNVQGTVTDNPLTNVATTLNSAGLANLSAVSGNHAVIVLDPLRTDGAPEIVIVTAHTGSATSATISRGAYGTSARQHAAGTLWVHPVTKDDLIQVLTANPTDVYEGQFWYRSDTDIYMAHNGTSAVEALPIGAWQSYTPSNTNITVGNGTQVAKYTRLGRLVTVSYDLLWGSTTSYGGNIRIGVPVAAAASGVWAGLAVLTDTSVNDYPGGVYLFGGGTQVFTLKAAGGAVNATAPFTWVNTDRLSFSLTYEAAS